ncbi:two-component system, OmpR family, sensor kinase [Fervidobacterium changbaicum]|uniref:histidine kinase n=2 Tax=Fervidobacterium TaxID=2422 RepID=A0AAI8CKG1_FERIS|nr:MULTISPECIES: ATP-binding protein [Fervidobacterium]AMW32065.1 HAMP domain-containing histidine kinase [Fervidobacterium islandicum]QAV33854.1 GHKL domain-containing protein [Fervidobacterium changbaicum]SDH45628.1 two-component system, OmpR family, sensor kinase [Fervidobacterium changbaicum]
MEIQQLLSKYMLEISKVDDENKLYGALVGILKRIVDFQVLNVLSNNEVIYSEPQDVTIAQEYYADYLQWIEERLHPTFLPFEDVYVGLIPIFKGTKILSVAVILTTTEPTAEVIDYLQLIAYLSGITLENLRLFKIVDDSRQYYETIINVSNDGIIVFKDGQVEFKNLRAEQVISEHNRLLDEILKNTQNGVEFFEFEEANAFFSVSIKHIKLFGEDRVLVNIRNITTEKEIQKLKEVDKIKANFIANISHELRTPLAAIKAYVETILSMPMSYEEIQEFISIVHEQSLRLEQLLNDLLDFSQLESGTMRISLESANLCDIVDQAITVVQKLAEEKNVQIMKECSPVVIKCDPRRIEQVIVNLLSNSIKFSDQQKENKFTKITASDEGEKVRISVEDNGIGIPEDKLDRIFDKFYRVDNELTYSIPGTGLGLAIVKEIVEMHGGEIHVKSKVGEGSIFEVVLPKEQGA